MAEFRHAHLAADASPDRVGDLTEVVRQLRDYFAGGRADFTVPLRLDGTPFQERVWSALRAIPFGETISYRETHWHSPGRSDHYPFA
jgi:methylated-DNA-[protein]-cysteine S-methyltransferase